MANDNTELVVPPQLGGDMDCSGEILLLLSDRVEALANQHLQLSKRLAKVELAVQFERPALGPLPGQTSLHFPGPHSDSL